MKHNPATMPDSVDEAIAWAEQHEQWAKDARERDMPGSAYEFELTALLLRHWAATAKPQDKATEPTIPQS